MPSIQYFLNNDINNNVNTNININEEIVTNNNISIKEKFNAIRFNMQYKGIVINKNQIIDAMMYEHLNKYENIVIKNTDFYRQRSSFLPNELFEISYNVHV